MRARNHRSISGCAPTGWSATGECNRNVQSRRRDGKHAFFASRLVNAMSSGMGVFEEDVEGAFGPSDLVSDGLERIAQDVALVLVGRRITAWVRRLHHHPLPNRGRVDKAQDAIAEGAGRGRRFTASSSCGDSARYPMRSPAIPATSTTSCRWPYWNERRHFGLALPVVYEGLVRLVADDGDGLAGARQNRLQIAQHALRVNADRWDYWAC